MVDLLLEARYPLQQRRLVVASSLSQKEQLQKRQVLASSGFTFGAAKSDSSSKEETSEKSSEKSPVDAFGDDRKYIDIGGYMPYCPFGNAKASIEEPLYFDYVPSDDEEEDEEVTEHEEEIIDDEVVDEEDDDGAIDGQGP